MNPEPLPPVACPGCGSIELTPRLTGIGYDVFQCERCDLTFGIPPTYTSQDFEDYWWTKEFTESFDQYVENAIRSLRAKLKVFGRHLSGIRCTSMLDVGCGNGAYIAAGERLGMICEGTDIDNANVQFARKKGLNAFKGMLDAYEPGKQFDFVHVKGTLHLVLDSKRFIGQIANLTSSGGMLYIDAVHQDGGAAFLRKVWRGGRGPPVRTSSSTVLPSWLQSSKLNAHSHARRFQNPAFCDLQPWKSHLLPCAARHPHRPHSRSGLPGRIELWRINRVLRAEGLISMAEASPSERTLGAHTSREELGYSFTPRSTSFEAKFEIATYMDLEFGTDLRPNNGSRMPHHDLRFI